MLYARDDISGEEIVGDPSDFERFVATEMVDVAEYPNNYDPDDPEQETIIPRLLRVHISVTSEPYNDGQSFEHISSKSAIKHIKKVSQGLK